MKVAIMGGGAMGGLWADHLQRAGNDVVIVDVAQAVVNAVLSDGLAVTAEEGVRRSQPGATTNIADAGGVDVAYVFTKAHHTRAAAETLLALPNSAATIVSLQNGWGNGDVIASVIGPERLVFGVTYQSARVDAPGAIAHTSSGPTVIGPFVSGAGMDRAEEIAALQSHAGLPTTATDGVKTEIWKKVVLNTATLPTSALTGLFAGELGRPGPMLDLAEAIARESVGILRAAGYDIDPEERVEFINGLLGRAGRGKASMLQDVEARRKTEVEVVNGAIVREADRLGADAPLNRAMVALIGGLERSWSQS
jgi:2-dehydropantoate 2-reductase